MMASMRKHSMWVLLIGSLAIGLNTYATDKVIYGEDNRMEIGDSSSLYQEWGKSTVAMIHQDKLKAMDNGLYYEIKMERPLLNVCSDELFAGQMMAANCSGFLAGPDIIVTAGHCMQSLTACQDFRWVFDYRSDFTSVDQAPLLQMSNVYSCKKIITKVLDMNTKMDYAIVKLDRRVRDRYPLSMRREGDVAKDESMVVIGHPSGLPMKITDHALVRSHEHSSFFVINSDTFQGNSGSPVINSQTGKVEGILVRGDRDYKYDMEKGCYAVNRCEQDGCRGEDVTKITKIPEMMNQDILQ